MSNFLLTNDKKEGYSYEMDSPLSREDIMCRQETALEVIKSMPKKGGMSKAIEKMFEAQVVDYKEVRTELKTINSKISDIEKVQIKNSEKIDKIIEMHKRPSFLKTIQEVLSNKVFLYILITIICACFGVSVGEVGTFIFK